MVNASSPSTFSTFNVWKYFLYFCKGQKRRRRKLQCDQMTRLLFIIWPFKNKENLQYSKVSSKFCQILNRPCKSCQSLLRFGQSGKISPTLVTLSECVRSYILRHLLKKKKKKFVFDILRRMIFQRNW